MRQVLRRTAETGEGVHDAVLPDLGQPCDDDVRDQAYAAAQGDARSDGAEGSDLDVIRQPGGRVDKRGRMDQRHQVSTTIAANSTSAAIFSPTMAWPRNLNSCERALRTSTGMRSTSPGLTG